MRSLLMFFLFTGIGHLYAQQEDSTVYSQDLFLINNKMRANDLQTISGPRLTMRTLIVPVSLITYGVISQANDDLREFDVGIKSVVRKDADFHSPLDNYLQYAPGLAVYGLNAVGIKGEHNFRDRTMIYLLSNVMMGITVQSIKKITRVRRPDGFGANAFPSGHTATAFVGAEFLRQEYKNVSP